jgi:hypothetical protein
MAAMDVHPVHVPRDNGLTAQTMILVGLKKLQLGGHLLVGHYPSSPVNLSEFILCVMYHAVREVVDLQCKCPSQTMLRCPKSIVAGSVFIEVSVHALDRI